MDKEQLDDWITREPGDEEQEFTPPAIKSIVVQVGWLRVEVNEYGQGKVIVTNEHGEWVVIEQEAKAKVSVEVDPEEAAEIESMGTVVFEIGESE